jgi:DNA-binding phage protein
MSALACDTRISLEGLDEAFSDNENPTLDTLLRVIKAVGVRLAVAALSARSCRGCLFASSRN